MLSLVISGASRSQLSRQPPISWIISNGRPPAPSARARSATPSPLIHRVGDIGSGTLGYVRIGFARASHPAAIRRAIVAGHDQRITLSGPVQKRLSRRGRAIRNLAEGGVVLVGDNLQRRVHDVTREYALGAIRMQVEGQHACCVTGQRLDIETARNAWLTLFDQIDLAGVDDWRDAVSEHARRIRTHGLVDIGAMQPLEIDPGIEIPRLWERRRPLFTIATRVPANMV